MLKEFERLGCLTASPCMLQQSGIWRDGCISYVPKCVDNTTQDFVLEFAYSPPINIRTYLSFNTYLYCLFKLLSMDSTRFVGVLTPIRFTSFQFHLISLPFYVPSCQDWISIFLPLGVSITSVWYNMFVCLKNVLNKQCL